MEKLLFSFYKHQSGTTRRLFNCTLYFTSMIHLVRNIYFNGDSNACGFQYLRHSFHDRSNKIWDLFVQSKFPARNLKLRLIIQRCKNFKSGKLNRRNWDFPWRSLSRFAVKTLVALCKRELNFPQDRVLAALYLGGQSVGIPDQNLRSEHRRICYIESECEHSIANP